jgi:predicted ArsR family transcriptional regulator
MIQATSLISYYEILNKLGDRQKEVLLGLKHLGIANNLQISRYLGLPINSITPRMVELRKRGIVIYHHTSACPVTGRASRFFTIKSWIKESMD